MQELQKLWHHINVPRTWWVLAILQILIFLTLYLTWAPITLRFVVPSAEVKYWESLIKTFETKHPEIQIQLSETDRNTTDLVKESYISDFPAKNSRYDLVYMDIIWVSEFAENGWLQDISNRISQEELDNFLTGDVESGRYQGRLYRIPFRSDAGVLYYRKDLLEKNGFQPPETFTELLNISLKLQQQKQVDWGYLWQGQKYEGMVAMFVEILKGYGGFWVNTTTNEVGLNQLPALQAVKFLQSTIEQGISPPFSVISKYDEEASFSEFAKGKTVFLRNWPYIWQRVNQDSTLKDKVGIVGMVHESGYSSGACRGGWGFGIAKNTKHSEAAWQAIKFFTSLEAQRSFVLKSGYLPSRRTLFTDTEIVKKYPHFPDLLTVAEQSVLRPAIPKYDELSRILQEDLALAISKQMSVEDAMKNADRDTRNLLNKAKQ
jgi:multiple sugar transport system substrate-binding protein